MKTKDKKTIVEMLMGIFEPKKNNRYDHKQVKSAENMANLILEGPSILFYPNEIVLHSTGHTSSNN